MKYITGLLTLIGLIFLGVGIKRCIEGDYLSGSISLLMGALFIVSLVFKKGVGKK